MSDLAKDCPIDKYGMHVPFLVWIIGRGVEVRCSGCGMRLPFNEAQIVYTVAAAKGQTP